MHHTITSGSKEYLLVTIGDRLETIASLAGLSARFDVRNSEDTLKQTNVSADITGMIMKCLVDTTAGGNWPSGIYRLFPKLTATPEEVILRPVEFRVEEI